MAGFFNPGYLSPYLEQNYNRGRSHKTMYKPNDTAPSNFMPYDLDQEKIIKASQILNFHNVPPTVIREIAHKPKECIESLIFLLKQVQNGVDVEWLSDVTESLQEHTIQPEATATDQDFICRIQSQPSVRSHRTRRSGWSSTTLGHSSTYSNEIHKPILPERIAELSQEELPNHVITDFSQPVFTKHEVHHNLSNSFSPAQLSPSSRSQPQSHYVDLPSLRPHASDSIPFTDLHMTAVPTSQPSFFLDDDASSQEVQSLFEDASVFGNLYSQNSSLIESRHQTSLIPSRLVTQSPSSCSIGNTIPASSPQAMLGAKPPRPPKVPINDSYVQYTSPPARRQIYRSPCPQCHSDFSSQREYINHIQAEHDQPVEYHCLHKVTDRQDAPRCSFRTCRSAQFVRHHTDHHKGCCMPQGEDGRLPNCRKDVSKLHKKRVWGCWFCVRAFPTVELWVRHQFEQHYGCSRRKMDVNCFITSLLSQECLQTLWQNEVEQLEDSTGHTWDLKWCEEPHDTNTRQELIQELETGHWGNQDFWLDASARQDIVKSAMDATMHMR